MDQLPTKKPWYRRWWVIALLVVVFMLELYGPIGYFARGRASAFRVFPLATLSVRRNNDGWIVEPCTATTEQRDTLYIYTPQDFPIRSDWASVEGEHRKWVMMLEYKWPETDYPGMLTAVEEYLKALPADSKNQQAIAVVHELRTMPDSRKGPGPNYWRSDRYPMRSGYLHNAVTFVAGSLLLIAFFLNLSFWFQGTKT